MCADKTRRSGHENFLFTVRHRDRWCRMWSSAMKGEVMILYENGILKVGPPSLKPAPELWLCRTKDWLDRFTRNGRWRGLEIEACMCLRSRRWSKLHLPLFTLLSIGYPNFPLPQSLHKDLAMKFMYRLASYQPFLLALIHFYCFAQQIVHLGITVPVSATWKILETQFRS